ncbi:MAG: sigma-70 family RNA polymerase sigma factor [Prevotella sp.]|nr:sigma-70 family RNA polymerase sigma factor [Prevotella sp.]
MKKISFRTDVLPLKNELFRVAQRITLNREEAEDVVQETMIKVWNRRESWEEIENIEAFCLTICRNLALDKTRRMDNRNPSLEATRTDAADGSYGADPEEQAIQRDRIRLVRRLIDRLPEKQRSIMQLRDIEGKSYRDIAQLLSITEEQVKVNIFRARQSIKKEFTKTEQYGL